MTVKYNDCSKCKWCSGPGVKPKSMRCLNERVMKASGYFPCSVDMLIGSAYDGYFGCHFEPKLPSGTCTITAVEHNDRPQNCPWCGHKAIIINNYFVSCDNDNCGASGPITQTKYEAIKAWNSIRMDSTYPFDVVLPGNNISDDDDDKPTTNQGREYCFKCGAKTQKVDTGMFTVLDICPKCKI